jgi:hypothetical protein
MGLLKEMLRNFFRAVLSLLKAWQNSLNSSHSPSSLPSSSLSIPGNLLSWSDPPHTDFRVRIFLDTNVLVFLIDHTYQSLNDFVEIVNESPFVELISSHYVMFEFFGARKREHYLRIAAARAPKTAGGQLNFSSLLKFKDDYQIPGTLFEDVMPTIRNSVMAEVATIASDFKINFEYGSFHQDQLQPTRDVCLASKLQNQDCLVLISAILPEPNTTQRNVLLLTKDENFVKHFESADLGNVLTSHAIFPPRLVQLNRMESTGTRAISLTTTIDPVSLAQDLKSYLLSMITSQLSASFLGHTFVPKSSAVPLDCVCFSLSNRTSFPIDVYVTVLSKDLDFIYTTRSKVSDFRHRGSPVSNSSVFPPGDNHISFRLLDVDESGNPKDMDQTILAAIRAQGNLVFIHPDSIPDS